MIKKCAFCSKDIGSNGIGLFCSKSCYSKNNYRVNNIYQKKLSPIICINCGKESIGKKNVRYCSNECFKDYIKAKTSKKVVEELECLCCKKKYFRAHKAQKYCSNECRNKSRKVVRFNKACKKCGELFPIKQGQIYCSVECKPKLVRKDTVKLICIECGNGFIGAKHHRYCSKKCRNKKKNRKESIQKEGKVCEYCGFSDTRAIHAHHINRSSSNEVMFLCANHHYIFHSIVGNGKKSENRSREEVLDILNGVVK